MIQDPPTPRSDTTVPTPAPPSADAEPTPATAPAATELAPATTGTDGRPIAAEPEPAGADDGSVRFARLRRSPLVRRVTGYSAGSVIAAFTSELAFAAALGWLHSGTTWASAAGFVGGAVPNYFLNRRWAWQDRNGRSRRSEIILYAAVSIASFLVSAVVTDVAEKWTKTLTNSDGLRVVLVAAAYLAVSGVFFVGKFVAYELIVFTKGPGGAAGSASPEDGPATTS